MRMHKCHSESNLSSIEYAQSKFVDSSDDFGIVHSSLARQYLRVPCQVAQARLCEAETIRARRKLIPHQVRD